jgi:anaerobic selenocysteine-containing dehydrogenase
MSERKERRLRIKISESVKEGKLSINPTTAQELGIADKVEIVVGGKKRLVLDAILSSETPSDQVFINPDFAKSFGIANNTIATIRKPLK